MNAWKQVEYSQERNMQVQIVHASKYIQLSRYERMRNTWGPFYSQINSRAAMDSMNAKWHTRAMDSISEGMN